ncbi:MAG: polysaccharide biosynthesis/export family protein [Vicinamibacterales bacterium]
MVKQLLLSCACAVLLAVPIVGQTSGVTPDYVIGPQDLLRIIVFDEPTLSNSYRVDSDGSFQYPFLGRVEAGGKTLRELEQLLSTRLEGGFVRRAQVTVEVEQARQRSVFVIGEVRSPGKYQMTGQMTMLEALAAAGSVTANAGSEVIVLRSGGGALPNVSASAPAGTNASGDGANVRRANLADLQLGRLSENLILEEGDTVFVPKAEKFYMTGQIKSPGAYTWERGLTVLQAISLAGGLTDKGSNRRMKVVRIVDGKQVEEGISLTDQIQPGDTIVIAQRLL